MRMTIKDIALLSGYGIGNRIPGFKYSPRCQRKGQKENIERD